MAIHEEKTTDAAGDFARLPPPRQDDAAARKTIRLIAIGLAIFGLLMAVGALRAGRRDLAVLLIICMGAFEGLWLLAVARRRPRPRRTDCWPPRDQTD